MTLQSISLAVSDLAPGLKNHLWQSTIFLIAAALLTLALRRNHARARYWLWLAASVKFLVPFSLLIALGSHLATPRPAAPAPAAVYYAMEEVSQPFTLPTTFIATPTPAAPNLVHLLPILIAAIWFSGFLIVLTIWFVYWRRVTAAIQQATTIHDGRELDLLRRLEERFATPRPIQLLLSPTTLGPGIYGIARPILIWPEGISQRLSDAHLESIFAHEICHVRRYDNLTAALHMLVEAIFWFHPLVWWLGARLEAERERACDESVLSLTTQPHIYAESILKICEFYVESPLPCVSGVTGADLKKRIVDILDKHATLKLTLSKKLLLTAATLATITIPILSGQAKGMQHLSALAMTISPTVPSSSTFMSPTPQTAGPISQTESQSDPTAASSQESADAKPLTFDVVSIRPPKPGNQNGTRLQFTADGLQVWNSSLNFMLGFVYQLQLQFMGDRIVGAPEWAKNDLWDVQAKVADSDLAEWSKLSNDLTRPAGMRRLLALNALLADQFKLKSHLETREGPIYALVVAKGGPKLQASKPDDPPSILMRHRGHLVVKGATIEAMAPFFAQTLGRIVVDKTGLTGKYDFTLDWTPDGSAETGDSPAPSIFTALQEQLGLKLEPQKGPVEYLVIDHVERPRAQDAAQLSAPSGPSLLPVALVQERPAGAATRPASSLPTDAPYVPTMTFDVASVRETKPDTNGHILMSYQFTPQTTHLQLSFNIENVLNVAYGVDRFQVVGAPDWPTAYTIEAKGDADADAKMAALTKEQQLAEQQHMLQALLADRFKLKTHWETKEGDTYNLVVAKGGPKLGAEGSMPPSADVVKTFGDRPVPVLRQVAFDGKPAWVAHDCSMDNWAALLTSMFGRPVTDKTGLTGKYDFVLKYKGRSDSDRSADDTDATPPMDRALQEELGLKVEPAKGPVKGLVIDHIEKPSPN